MTAEARPALLDRVRATIAAHALLPPGAPGRTPEPVVVGTSGGPDSVALLLALHALARRGDLAIAPVAAHLHHGLRGDTADADQVFVENLAARLGLACETARADVRAEAAAAGLGIEETARGARRRFLADVARRRGARAVALGHTADDRAETVLFHVLRGTGVEGLGALGPRAPLAPADGIEIVRPLIEVSRADVLAYLAAAGQPYREDETNSSDAFTRNRLRRDVLPAVREAVNPQADEALVRLSDQAAAAGEVLADALDAVWRQVVREVPAGGANVAPAGETDAPPGAVVIDADDFVPLKSWLQGAILRRAVERLGGGLKHMGADRTAEVLKALLAKTVVGPVALPGGLAAERNRRVIRIGPGE